MPVDQFRAMLDAMTRRELDEVMMQAARNALLDGFRQWADAEKCSRLTEQFAKAKAGRGGKECLKNNS